MVSRNVGLKVRNSQAQSGTFRNTQKQSETVKNCQKQSGTVRNCQKHSETSRNIQIHTIASVSGRIRIRGIGSSYNRPQRVSSQYTTSTHPHDTPPDQNEKREPAHAAPQTKLRSNDSGSGHALLRTTDLHRSSLYLWKTMAC